MQTSTTDRPSKYPLLIQIIVFNLIPIYGVLFEKWDARLFILAYFIETIIAMLFHTVRLYYVHFRWGNEPKTKNRAMELNSANGGGSMPGSIVPMFMLAVFGFFCFVQLFVLGGFANKAFSGGIFHHLYLAITSDLTWVVVSFFFLQLIQLVAEVIREQYAFVPVEALLMQPFRRILVQQLTVILGGFFILFSGPQVYVFVLVLVNICIDLFFVFMDNPKLRAMVTNNDPAAEKQYDDMKRMM